MRCLDFSSGKELWRFSYPATGTAMFPGSRSVPAVDESMSIHAATTATFTASTLTTHKPVWKKNIWTDFGGTKLPIWAITQCPLIYGNLLLVLSQAPEAGLVGNITRSQAKLSGKHPILAMKPMPARQL